MRLRVFLGLAVAVSASHFAVADHPSDERRSLADKHAPAGIMGDHIHDQGEWMVEYRYMNMYMEDNRMGTKTVSDADAIGALGTNNGATPTQMTMEMHMMHIMYGISDDVTLYTMLMLPSITMDHMRANTTEFTTHNSGFGDTGFGALLRLYSDDSKDVLLNLGCTVPTGDIFRTSRIPSNGVTDTPLPYPMRLGTGTFNFRPGITAKRYFEDWSLGGQLQADLPIGTNYRGYSVGEELRLNTWASCLLTESVSLSCRVENVWRENFDGEDPQTPNAMISTNVENFRGGYWLNVGVGAQASVHGHYLNFEVVPNLTQDLDGIQLETDYTVIGSWSKAF